MSCTQVAKKNIDTLPVRPFRPYPISVLFCESFATNRTSSDSTPILYNPSITTRRMVAGGAHESCDSIQCYTGSVQILKNKRLMTVHGSTYQCKGPCQVKMDVEGVWPDVSNRKEFISRLSKKKSRMCKCKEMAAGHPQTERAEAEVQERRSDTHEPAQPQGTKRKEPDTCEDLDDERQSIHPSDIEYEDSDGCAVSAWLPLFAQPRRCLPKYSRPPGPPPLSVHTLMLRVRNLAPEMLPPEPPVKEYTSMEAASCMPCVKVDVNAPLAGSSRYVRYAPASLLSDYIARSTRRAGPLVKPE